MSSTEQVRETREVWEKARVAKQAWQAKEGNHAV